MHPTLQDGIPYNLPTVTLLQETGIGTAEVAARTCYDSFNTSEHKCVQDFNNIEEFDGSTAPDTVIVDVNNIPESKLLHKLAWTHFHHSILEHANLTYLIKGTSRGVLQEHARHRMQAISVRSTRYTMSGVINAFTIEMLHNPVSTYPSNWFIDEILQLDLFVTTDDLYNKLQIVDMFNKLKFQALKLGKEAFIAKAIAKSSIPLIDESLTMSQQLLLINNGKSKRNVGDAFKHIVNDNWKVDMVVTFNLRSLKNYLDLRDSGAAFFQIQWLAQAIKAATPDKYINLIVKST